MKTEVAVPPNYTASHLEHSTLHRHGNEKLEMYNQIINFGVFMDVS
jgi:hypothetical protein